MNHVSTQLPYAITVAIVSGLTYLLAGVVQSFVGTVMTAVICLPVGIVMIIGTLLVIRAKVGKEEA